MNHMPTFVISQSDSTTLSVKSAYISWFHILYGSSTMCAGGVSVSEILYDS